MGSPVADLAKWSPPQRRRTTDDGDVIVEKLSPLPSVMMVDKAGNLVQLSLSNGISNRNPNDPYRTQVLPEKMTQGEMVRLDRCPLGVSESIAYLPPTVRFRVVDGKPDRQQPKGPCMQAAEGGKITAATPCACIAELIRVRRERNAAKDARNEDRVNKLAKLAEQTATANRDAATGLAAAAQSMAAAVAGFASSAAAAPAASSPAPDAKGKAKAKDPAKDETEGK